jgi:hypothetical protein
MNEEERLKQNAAQEALELRNMSIDDLHNKMVETFKDSWNNQRFSDIPKSNSYFAAILIILYRKAEDQSKQIIDLTQKLIELSDQTKKYTRNLRTYTIGLFILTGILVLFGGPVFFQDLHKIISCNNMFNTIKENKDYSSEQKTLIKVVKPSNNFGIGKMDSLIQRR